MASSASTPMPYSPANLPILGDGLAPYLQRELNKIRDAIYTTQRMTPQAASTAPKVLLDGMPRLSRYPWWPVSGQTADAWVYYDAVGKVWRYSSTAPTSSH